MKRPCPLPRLLAVAAYLAFGLIMGGCASHGSRPGGSGAGEAFGAQRVAVQLHARYDGLDAFRASLERILTQRYQRSGETTFREIRFEVDQLTPDPANAQDLLLTGRLVVQTRHGTQERTLERRIHQGATTAADRWPGKFLTDLVKAVDYQLQLLRP